MKAGWLLGLTGAGLAVKSASQLLQQAGNDISSSDTPLRLQGLFGGENWSPWNLPLMLAVIAFGGVLMLILLVMLKMGRFRNYPRTMPNIKPKGSKLLKPSKGFALLILPSLLGLPAFSTVILDNYLGTMVPYNGQTFILIGMLLFQLGMLVLFLRARFLLHRQYKRLVAASKKLSSTAKAKSPIATAATQKFNAISVGKDGVPVTAEAEEKAAASTADNAAEEAQKAAEDMAAIAEKDKATVKVNVSKKEDEPAEGKSEPVATKPAAPKNPQRKKGAKKKKAAQKSTVKTATTDKQKNLTEKYSPDALAKKVAAIESAVIAAEETQLATQPAAEPDKKVDEKVTPATVEATASPAPAKPELQKVAAPKPKGKAEAAPPVRKGVLARLSAFFDIEEPEKPPARSKKAEAKAEANQTKVSATPHDITGKPTAKAATPVVPAEQTTTGNTDKTATVQETDAARPTVKVAGGKPTAKKATAVKPEGKRKRKAAVNKKDITQAKANKPAETPAKKQVADTTPLVVDEKEPAPKTTEAESRTGEPIDAEKNKTSTVVVKPETAEEDTENKGHEQNTPGASGNRVKNTSGCTEAQDGETGPVETDDKVANAVSEPENISAEPDKDKPEPAKKPPEKQNTANNQTSEAGKKKSRREKLRNAKKQARQGKRK